MSTTITETEMTSDLTHHKACRDAIEPTWWWVSWLTGGQVCDYSQALTAMTIAELVAQGVKRGHEDWPLLRDLAGELLLTADAALRMAGESR